MALDIPCSCERCPGCLEGTTQATLCRSKPILPSWGHPCVQAKLQQTLPLPQHRRGRSSKPAAGRNWLHELPQAVVDRIARHLDYRDLLFLRRLSRRLSVAINPQLASWESKVSLVARAERGFPRNFWPHLARLGCYSCFTVLPKYMFAEQQPAVEYRKPSHGGSSGSGVGVLEPRPVRLRRICIECGMRGGYYNPGDLLSRLKTDFPSCEGCQRGTIRASGASIDCRCRTHMRRAPPSVMWICNCRVLRDSRMIFSCLECRRTAPLSQPFIDQ
ncbi:hypothetical protein BX600DRAFT_448645 [Xylariales sp. PMI_506]|nr:hypothetical protein BX600DRAFT_448645 [Xylariales sp. PMI_506]